MRDGDLALVPAQRFEPVSRHVLSSPRFDVALQPRKLLRLNVWGTEDEPTAVLVD